MIISYIFIFITLFLEPLMEKTYLPAVLILAQLIFIIYSYLYKDKTVSKIFYYLLFYLLIVLILTFIHNPISYYGYGLRILTYFMQIVIGTQFFNYFLENQKQREKIITIFLYFMIVLSIYIILEGVLQKNILFIRLFREQWQIKAIYGYGRGYRSAGSMESPLVMSFPIILAFFITYFKVRIRKELKYILPLFLFLISSYFFRARTVFLVVILLIISIELFKILNNKKFTSGVKSYFTSTKIYSLLILILLIIVLYSKPIINMFTSNTMSYIHRLSSIRYTLVEFLNGSIFQILFGRGFGSLSYKVFSEEITITDAGFYAIDNEFVTFLFEFGFFGLIILSIILFYFLRNSKDKSKEIIFLNIVVIFLISFYTMIFNIFHWYSITVLISLVVAYIVSINKEEYLNEEI